MENYVKDKVVAITGAGNGFGRITAQKIAEMGGKVVISDIVAERVDETLKEIRDAGGEAAGSAGDVSKREDVAALVDLAVKTFGRLDCFIANAGTMPLGFWSEHEKAVGAWEKCIDIGLKGVMYSITESYNQMIQQGKGQIIVISSIYANFPLPGSGIYQATKIGVRYLADTLRLEARGKIKVSIVNPTAAPQTGLMSTVVNRAAAAAGLGGNAKAWMDAGGPDLVNHVDIENIETANIPPELIVTEGVLHCLNQPWGVNIGEITVRGSGEYFVV